MKYTIGLSLIVLVLFASCSESPKEQGLQRIHELEKSDSTLSNPHKLAELNELYKEYLTKYPDDPKSSDFIFKAAEASNMLGQYPEAVRLYDQFVLRNPDDKRTPHAAFMKAFVLENGMRELGKASDAYRQFLEKYPKHELADDAKASLENMGKSDEELIRQFEQMQQNPPSDSTL